MSSRKRRKRCRGRGWSRGAWSGVGKQEWDEERNVGVAHEGSREKNEV